MERFFGSLAPWRLHADAEGDLGEADVGLADVGERLVAFAEVAEPEGKDYVALEAGTLHEVDAAADCGRDVAKRRGGRNGVEAIAGARLEKHQCRARQKAGAKHDVKRYETVACAQRLMHSGTDTEQLDDLVAIAEENLGVERRHIRSREIEASADLQSYHKLRHLAGAGIGSLHRGDYIR